MANPINLEGETWDRAVQVADGFWVIAAQHRPGYSDRMPMVNNRVLVFRLKEGERQVLVVVNGIPESAIPEVKRIASETGLPVAYNISPGGGHHVTLDRWHDEFPTATTLIGPVRIPRTANGQKLLKLPRVRVMDLNDPLPQFKGQLDAVLFDGLLGFRDNLTPKEGAKQLSGFGQMVMMFREMPPKDPTDELWLHHVATGTVIGGENLGWILTPEWLKTMPFMFRMMMKANTVYVADGPRRVSDKARVAAHWEKILSWPAKTVMTYHDSPTLAYFGDGQAALGAAARKVKQIS
jgi:hypothetical protein